MSHFFNDPHILIHEVDHASVAITRLKSQFIGCPRIEALVRAIGAGVQALEEEIFTLIVARTLTASTGAQLDQWGSVVGEPRGGLPDSSYRLLINVRAFANRSRGSNDQLIEIAQITTAPSEVRQVDMFPAGLQINIRRDTLMSERRRGRVRRLLKDVKPAGVALLVVESVGGGFGFEGNPDAGGYNQGGYARVL